MSLNQFIVVDFGVTIRGKVETEAFAETFVRFLEEAGAADSVDLEQAKDFPEEASQFMDENFPGVSVSNIWDEDGMESTWVVAWEDYRKRVDNRYESYPATALEPVPVPEALERFLEKLNVFEKPSWVFYVYRK